MVKSTVALCQMDSQDDKERNVTRAIELLEAAGERGATIAALPEMFTFMGDKDEYRTHAEPVPGPVTERLGEIADRYDMYVHGGSMFEPAPVADKVYNTSVVFSPSGDRIGQYRKLHLFDVEIGDEVVTQESARVEPGDAIETIETTRGTFGLAICYDLRFPELFSSLAHAGADVIFMPAAFTKHTGKDHWEPLLRARAIETQSYVIAPGQIGEKPTGIPSYGRSLVADPWGNVIAKAPDRETVVTAEIDLDHLASIRRELPSLSHKRFDAYRPEG
jgi:predicted amidohydrolase